jgi:hypothetical protein
MKVPPRMPKRVGIANHGGFHLKAQRLRTFFAPQFSGEERRLLDRVKLAGLESRETRAWKTIFRNDWER